MYNSPGHESVSILSLKSNDNLVQMFTIEYPNDYASVKNGQVSDSLIRKIICSSKK